MLRRSRTASVESRSPSWSFGCSSSSSGRSATRAGSDGPVGPFGGTITGVRSPDEPVGSVLSWRHKSGSSEVLRAVAAELCPARSPELPSVTVAVQNDGSWRRWRVAGELHGFLSEIMLPLRRDQLPRDRRVRQAALFAPCAICLVMSGVQRRQVRQLGHPLLSVRALRLGPRRGRRGGSSRCRCSAARWRST